MARKGSNTSWWRERFGPRGSFAEQASLVTQDFGLVVMLLGYIGIIHELIQYPVLVPMKPFIEPILLGAAVVQVATFAIEGTYLLVIAARREIRHADRSRDQGLEKACGRNSSDSTKAGSAFSAFCAANDAKIARARTESQTGRFTFDISDVPRAVARLGAFYNNFDAVSCCELPFWHTSGDQFAQEYFRQAVDLVREGIVVTRMFIVSREEFEQGADLLFPVLLKHQKAGIGFAVIPYEELGEALREDCASLDFGLWNGGSAYSRFRQREGAWKRTMYVEFANDGRNPCVAEKVALYKNLLCHVWLADEAFILRHSATIATLGAALQRNNRHLQRRIGSELRPEENYYLEVRSDGELRGKVDSLFRLWTLAADEQLERNHDVQQANTESEDVEDSTIQTR